MTNLADDVAREVMGWRADDAGLFWLDASGREVAGKGVAPITIMRGDLWTPETDPRDWMRVVERMRELGYEVNTYRRPRKDYVDVVIRLGRSVRPEGKARGPEGTAICEAALAAVRSQGPTPTNA